MTPPPEPRTTAGRLLVDTISEYQGEPDDGQWTRRILAIEAEAEAEAAGAPLPPLDAHDTHTPCCAIPAEHKWADPIRCLKDHEDWPCRAAIAARQPAPEPFYDSDGIPIPDELFAAMEPAPAPLDVTPETLTEILLEPSVKTYWLGYNFPDESRAPGLARAIVDRLTARAAATDHEGFSPTQPGNTHWKRTPLARAAATEDADDLTA